MSNNWRHLRGCQFVIDVLTQSCDFHGDVVPPTPRFLNSSLAGSGREQAESQAGEVPAPTTARSDELLTYSDGPTWLTTRNSNT